MSKSKGEHCPSLLSDKYDYEHIAFSHYIKEEAKNQGYINPERYVLQNVGNEKRKGNLTYWADIMIKIIKSSNKAKSYVVDGFRNVAEIRAFQTAFCDKFILLAMNVDDRMKRFDRIKEKYVNKTIKQFVWEDNRDRGERYPYGQQVASCIYNADIVLDNNENFYDLSLNTELDNKIKRYIDLINGLKNNQKEKCIDIEFMMQTAFVQGNKSPCEKRQVGAAIFTKNKKLISTGFNKPPLDWSCKEKFGRCHKELRQEILYKSLWEFIEGKTCPQCNKAVLRDLKVNHYYCEKCGFDAKSEFVPTKGSDHCIALHAEEYAIKKASEENLKDAMLFTTTFPCLQCALKIAETGISKITYIDPYRLPETELILRDIFKNMDIEIFEGVKSSSAFNRFFYNTEVVQF